MFFVRVHFMHVTLLKKEMSTSYNLSSIYVVIPNAAVEFQSALPLYRFPLPSNQFSIESTLALCRCTTRLSCKKTLSTSPTPASETQSLKSPSQPQSHASVPIDVTFPRHVPELPRKQISPEVLASLGYTSEVPSQYICDQMQCLQLARCKCLMFFTIQYIPQ
jgi:hypothetical protein